jgi:5-methylcytosine-specific restriction endonuclease McrA
MAVARPCLSCRQLTAAGSYCQNCKRWPSSPGRLRGRRGQELRARVLNAFAHKCAHCGATGVRLEVHHVDHDHQNNAPTNLTVLCKACHAKAGLRLL